MSVYTHHSHTTCPDCETKHRDGMDYTGPVPGWVKILRKALEERE